jgi:hypothetical protein
MTSTEILRNSIIDELLTISDKSFLQRLYAEITASKHTEDKVELSQSQILMLKMSEADVKNNRLISQEDLDKNDLEWLKEL